MLLLPPLLSQRRCQKENAKFLVDAGRYAHDKSAQVQTNFAIAFVVIMQIFIAEIMRARRRFELNAIDYWLTDCNTFAMLIFADFLNSPALFSTYPLFHSPHFSPFSILWPRCLTTTEGNPLGILSQECSISFDEFWVLVKIGALGARKNWVIYELGCQVFSSTLSWGLK